MYIGEIMHYSYISSEHRLGLSRTLPLFKYSPILDEMIKGYGCSPSENTSQQVTPNAH